MTFSGKVSSSIYHKDLSQFPLTGMLGASYATQVAMS